MILESKESPPNFGYMRLRSRRLCGDEVPIEFLSRWRMPRGVAACHHTVSDDATETASKGAVSAEERDCVRVWSKNARQTSFGFSTLLYLLLNSVDGH